MEGTRLDNPWSKDNVKLWFAWSIGVYLTKLLCLEFRPNTALGYIRTRGANKLQLPRPKILYSDPPSHFKEHYSTTPSEETWRQAIKQQMRHLLKRFMKHHEKDYLNEDRQGLSRFPSWVRARCPTGGFMGYNTNIFLLELFMRHQQTDCREQRQRSFPWPSLLGVSENKLHKDGEILCRL